MLQNTDNPFLLPEDGNPKNSLSNLYALEREHGPIVGAFHRVEVKVMAESTSFFFDDGHVHNCIGFSIIDKDIRTIHLKAALCRIPILSQAIEGPFITELIEDDEIQESLVDNSNTLVLVFRPMTGSGVEIRQLVESKGYAGFDFAVQKLLDMENNTIIEPVS